MRPFDMPIKNPHFKTIEWKKKMLLPRTNTAGRSVRTYIYYRVLDVSKGLRPITNIDTNGQSRANDNGKISRIRYRSIFYFCRRQTRPMNAFRAPRLGRR